MKKKSSRLILIALIALILVIFQFDRISSYLNLHNISWNGLFNSGQMTTDATRQSPDHKTGEKQADKKQEPVKADIAKLEKTKGPRQPEVQVTHVKPSGKVHLAGVAEPGWTVELRSGTKLLASFQADPKDGRWFHTLENELAPGEYNYTLSSLSPDGKKKAAAKEAIKFAVDAGQRTSSDAQKTADAGKKDASQETGKQDTAKTESKKQETAQTGTMLKSGSEEIKTRDMKASDIKEGQTDQKPGDQKLAAAQSDSKKGNVSLPYLSIENIIYKTLRNKKTQLIVNGAALPGMDIRLLINQEVMAHQKVGENGKWMFKLDKSMKIESHSIRVEQRDKSGQLLAWVEEMFKPEEPVVTAKADLKPTEIVGEKTDAKQSEGKAIEQKPEQKPEETVVKTEPVKTESVKTEAAKTEPAKEEPKKTEPAKAEDVKKADAPAKSDASDKPKTVAKVTEKAATHTETKGKTEDKKPVRTAQKTEKAVVTGSIHTKSASAKTRHIRHAHGKTTRARHTAKSGKEKVVIVKPGDNLWKIAERHYGDGEKYRKVFRKNHDRIIKVQRIYPGQRLVLP